MQELIFDNTSKSEVTYGIGISIFNLFPMSHGEFENRQILKIHSVTKRPLKLVGYDVIMQYQVIRF